MVKRSSAVLGLAAAALLVVPPVHAYAQVDDPVCGELYESVTLPGDVACDIEIMAPDIVLDLNGFHVAGQIDVGRDDELTDDVAGSAVVNGSADLIRIAGRNRVRMYDLEADFVLASALVDFIDVDTRSVTILRSTTATFRGGSLRGFDSQSHYGCGTWDITYALVDRVSLDADCRMTINDSDVTGVTMGGVEVGGTLTMRKNRVTGSVHVDRFDTAVLRDNHFAAGAGVSASDLRGSHRFVSLDVTDNEFGDGSVDVTVESGAVVVVEGNLLRSGAVSVVETEIPEGPGPFGSIGRNWVQGSIGTGITVRGNHGVLVAGNLVVGNAGHGIDAPGAVDGGGNVAVGNGLTPECIGVTCGTK